MTFRKHRDSLPPYAHCVPDCPFMYGLESKFESVSNCKYNGGKGCGYCWNREMPEEQAEAEASKPAVRMPKLTTGTKLRIIAGIMAKYRENENRENQLYCDGIIDAVCSVMSFQEEEEYDV